MGYSQNFINYGFPLLTLLTLLTLLKPPKNGALSQFVTLQNKKFVLYYFQCEEEKLKFKGLNFSLWNGLDLLGIDWRDYVQVSIRRRQCV